MEDPGKSATHTDINYNTYRSLQTQDFHDEKEIVSKITVLKKRLPYYGNYGNLFLKFHGSISRKRRGSHRKPKSTYLILLSQILILRLLTYIENCFDGRII